MKKFWTKKLILCAIFILACVICEVITFSMMKIGFLPKYFLIEFTFILVIAGLIYVIPFNSVCIFLSSLVLLFQCILSISNVTLYQIFGDVFTMDLLTLAGEAREFLALNTSNWFWVFPFVILFAATLATQIFVLVKGKTEKFTFKKKNILSLAAMLFIFCIGAPFIGHLGAGSLPNDASNSIFGFTAKDNYERLSFKTNYFESFGTYCIIYKNIILGVDPGSILEKRTKIEAQQYFNTPLENPFYGPYSEWDKDNNLLVVMTESFDSFLLHPEYTPTMYQIANNGTFFSGYHAHAKTDVSEASFILGNYPEKENIVADWAHGGGTDRDMRSNIFANEFPFSLPNVFKQKENGYNSTNYFIAHNGFYYSRQYTHPDYGFDKVRFLEDYPTTDNPEFEDYEDYVWSWYMPEKYFVDSALDDMLPILPEGEKFYSHFSLIHPHQPYNIDLSTDDKYAFQFYEKINDDDFTELRESVSNATYDMFKVALAKAMVADEGIQYLLENLIERGLAENTTLLFYTDHSASGQNLTYLVKDVGKQKSPVYNIPATLWSPNINGVWTLEEGENNEQVLAIEKPKGTEGPVVVEKFINTFDLVPTVLDILGIEYNQKMYLGINAFAPEKSIVISRLGVIFNDLFCSDGIKLTYKDPLAITDDYNEFKQSFINFAEKWSYINKLFLKGNEIYFPEWDFDSRINGSTP